MKYIPESVRHQTLVRGGLPAWLPISALLLVGSASCSDQGKSQGEKSTLLVARSGSGSGMIVSMPEGINCGTTCTATFSAGTAITLTATPDSGSDFVGWSGECSGSSPTCQITLSAAKQVSARFEYNPLGARVCTPDGFCWENPRPLGATLLATWGASKTDVWAVGIDGLALHYDGQRWAPVATNVKGTLTGVWGSSGQDIWAVGRGGVVAHYDGTAWAAVSSGTTNHLTAVFGVGATNVFATGERGTILNGDYDHPIRTYTDLRMEMSCKLPARPT